MPQPQPFVRHYANLIWLLIHRPTAVEEQKSAMRRALSQALTRPHEISLTDLNVSVAEAAHVRPVSEDLPWISELAMRMAGHAVRSMSFESGATATDALNLARALTQPPSSSDEGAAFDARLVALGLKTIHVYIGREGFVRRATPAVGHAAIVGPARTPPLGIRAVSRSTARAHTQGGLRITTAAASPLPPGFEAVGTPASAKRGHAAKGVPDESARIYETALSVGNVSRELEQLLVRLDAPMDANAAAKQMEEVARAAEQRAAQGLWVDVLEICTHLLHREAQEKDPGVRRAVVVAVRRLNQRGLLKGIAQLLPRRRELRDDATLVLARYGDTASDVLIELLVGTDAAPERRAYRVALTHCPAAVPAVIHLLGDPRWFVIRNAAELLGEMGVTEADGKLAQAMRHPDARVRRAAAAALARLGTPRALHALEQSLTDKAPAVRLQSALGLGTIRNLRALPAVMDVLDNEEDPDVQAALLSALGSMPTAEAVERLRRAAEPGTLMNRKSISVRLHAIQALADAGTHSAYAALRTFLKDRDKEVQAKVDRLLDHRAYAS
jgi:hypothetical protein